MTTRRYRTDEVREIFSLATTGDARDSSMPVKRGGLTLTELQRIGQIAGIDPARVEQAAERLDARGSPTIVRRSFGLPVEVSRIVELPRAPTDREWEQLISESTTVFGVHGRVTTTGGLRDWSHGNLRISVEPTAEGQQLRLNDLKDEAVAINGVGFLMVGMGVLMGGVLAAIGKPDKALAVLGTFTAMAMIPFFAANLVRTPAWARERERQFEAIAEHIVRLLSPP